MATGQDKKQINFRELVSAFVTGSWKYLSKVGEWVYVWGLGLINKAKEEDSRSEGKALIVVNAEQGLRLPKKVGTLNEFNGKGLEGEGVFYLAILSREFSTIDEPKSSESKP